MNNLEAGAYYPNTAQTLMTTTNWSDGTTKAYYNYFPSPPCSVHTGTNGVCQASGLPGDWDTGPGFAPDGAQINLPDSGTTNAPAAK